jgi:ketosteroid isomerase-like protein
MPNDNVELIRPAYDAFARGDIAGVMAVLADDIDWHAPALLPHGRDARGHDQVGEFFSGIVSTWEGLTLAIDDFVGSGDRVCVIGRASGTLDGTETGYGFCHCWTIGAGKAVRFDEFVDPDPELLAR